MHNARDFEYMPLQSLILAIGTVIINIVTVPHIQSYIFHVQYRTHSRGPTVETSLHRRLALRMMTL